jgi:hypothetical protein
LSVEYLPYLCKLTPELRQPKLGLLHPSQESRWYLLQLMLNLIEARKGRSGCLRTIRRRYWSGDGVSSLRSGRVHVGQRRTGEQRGGDSCRKRRILGGKGRNPLDLRKLGNGFSEKRG